MSIANLISELKERLAGSNFTTSDRLVADPKANRIAIGLGTVTYDRAGSGGATFVEVPLTLESYAKSFDAAVTLGDLIYDTSFRVPLRSVYSIGAGNISLDVEYSDSDQWLVSLQVTVTIEA